jgi:hypothetical protein
MQISQVWGISKEITHGIIKATDIPRANGRNVSRTLISKQNVVRPVYVYKVFELIQIVKFLEKFAVLIQTFG